MIGPRKRSPNVTAAAVSALGIGPVIVASIVPAVAAALFALVLNRLATRPSKILIGVSIAFGLLSMMGPATLPGASFGLRVVLALMHVVSGIAIPAGILRFGKRA